MEGIRAKASYTLKSENEKKKVEEEQKKNQNLPNEATRLENENFCEVNLDKKEDKFDNSEKSVRRILGCIPTRMNKEKKKTKFFALFRYGNAFDRFLLLMGIGCHIVIGVSLPVFMLLFGNLINDINTSGGNYTHFVIILAYLGLGAFFLMWIGVTSLQLLAERQVKEIKAHYFKAIIRQEIGWYDKNDGGTLSTRIETSIVDIQNAIGHKLGQFFMFGSMFVGGYILGFIKHFILTFVISSGLPVVACAGVFMGWSLKNASIKSLNAYKLAGSVAEETISGIRTITSFSNEVQSIERYSNHLHDAERASLKGSFFSALGAGCLFFAVFMMYALGFWYGGQLVAKSLENKIAGGKMNFEGGDAITVFFCILMGAFALSQMVPSLTTYFKGLGAVGDLYEVIDRPSLIDPFYKEGKRDITIMGEIEFRNVSFSYPTRSEVQIFKNLNLKIKAGETVALVGSSGCGKSTVVQLLQRFYDPIDGVILLDGIDLRDINVSYLRANMGVVSQEPRLFAISIGDNIALGCYDKDKECNMEKIIATAKYANAHNFIMQCKNKYNTYVGEGGGQLSGGQKQRIAIARAIIRKPSIIILDEATSALDNESERIVQTALDKIVENSKATTIIIAHRLSTIKNADRIIVLGNGDDGSAKVVEEGHHDTLMKNTHGLYYKLVKLQMQTSEENNKMSVTPSSAHVENEEEKEKLQIENNNSKMPTLPSQQLVSKYSQNESDAVNKLLKKYSSMEDKTSRSEIKKREVSIQQSSIFLERRLSSITAIPSMEFETAENIGWLASCCQVISCNKRKKERKTEKNKLKKVSMIRVFKLLKPQWYMMLFGLIAASANGCIFPCFSIVFTKFIGVYYGSAPQKIKDDSSYWSCMFVVIACCVLVVNILQYYCIDFAGHKLVTRLRKIAYTNILHQEIAFFDDPQNNTGYLSGVLSSEVALINGGVAGNTGVAIQSFSCLLAGIIIAFATNAELAGVVFAAFLVLIPAGMIKAQSMHREVKASKDADSTPASGKYVMNETIMGIKTIVAYGLEQRMVDEYNRYLIVDYRKGIKDAIIFGLLSGFSQCTQYCVNALALWYGAKLVSEKGVRPDDMMQTIFALLFAGSGSGQAVIFSTDQTKAKIAASRVFEIIDRKSAIDARDTGGIKFDNKNVTGNVEVSNIRFRYPQRHTVPIYKNVSFNVLAGETVALVGASGCGKSTVISLLERFYDVVESDEINFEENSKSEVKKIKGKICVDSIDVRDYNLKFLRSQMSLVSQEPILFNCSIADNIRYGKQDATDEEVIEAAKLSNAHNFISEFPEKYETNVGRFGSRLSGGQKQRIAIARAILRRPKILLLDEATSALDSESEKIVQDTIDNLMQTFKCTAIVVAHRLSTIRNADRIVVLSNDYVQGSSVVEIGNHNELMKLENGVYKQLCEMSCTQT